MSRFHVVDTKEEVLSILGDFYRDKTLEPNSKQKMFKKAISIAGLLFALGIAMPVIPQYGIKAQLDVDLNEIKVVEKIVFEHNESIPLEEIYLTDWNHAFNSTESP